MPRPAWIIVIAATFIGGAVAWLIVRQPARPASARLTRWDGADALDEDLYLDSLRWTDADDAVARHPAGRARAAEGTRRPKGPDDDPDFLRALDQVIRGTFGAGEEI